MNIIYNDKNLSFTEDELSYMYDGEGTESIIYKYKDKAFKIYKDFCIKDRIGLETVKKLSTIKTKRIILPEEELYNLSHKFIGYTSKYVDRYHLSNLYNLNKQKLLNELKLLYEDSDMLSDNNIDIEDLIKENTIYNDGIYICDPGSYIVNERQSKESIKYLNREKIDRFILDVVLKPSITLTKRQKQQLDSLLYEYKLEDLIKDEMNDDETVKKYVQKLSGRK